MYGSVGQRGKILNVLQMISLICTVLLQVSPHFYPQVEKLCQ